MNRILDAMAVTATWALSRLPRPWVLRFGRWLGAAFHLAGRRKNPRVWSNMELAGVEDPRQATSSAFRHMGQTLLEICWMLDRSPREALDGTEIHGMDEARRAAARGRGVLLVSAHAANWELVSMALSREDIAPMAVIARKLRTPGIERKQMLCRQRAGIRTLLRGERSSGITAYRLLARGGILGVMMDRLSAGRRIKVPFLGGATMMPLGPPELACRCGAAVVLGLAERLADGGTKIQFRELPVNDVTSAAEMAQIIATGLDRELRTRPEQWLWIARRQRQWQGEYTMTDR